MSQNDTIFNSFINFLFIKVVNTHCKTSAIFYPFINISCVLFWLKKQSILVPEKRNSEEYNMKEDDKNQVHACFRIFLSLFSVLAHVWNDSSV